MLQVVAVDCGFGVLLSLSLSPDSRIIFVLLDRFLNKFPSLISPPGSQRRMSGEMTFIMLPRAIPGTHAEEVGEEADGNDI